MVGPYLTARLANSLYIDAGLSWGLSDNHVSPYGTYEDGFSAERWLANAALIGEWDYDAFTIRPELKLSWFSEESETYTDSLDNRIPSVETALGTLEFGPTFLTDLALDNGYTLTPRGTVKGIWTFASEDRAGTNPAGLSRTVEAALDGVRASIEAGADLSGGQGFALSLSVSYDGIGDGDYEALGLRIGVRKAW